LIIIIVNHTIYYLTLNTNLKAMTKHLAIPVKQLLAALILILVVSSAGAQGRRRGAAGKAFEIQVTPYKTTMIANGKDEVMIKVAVIDGVGAVMTDAVNRILSRYRMGTKATQGPLLLIPQRRLSSKMVCYG
jgi:hypothetical protein